MMKKTYPKVMNMKAITYRACLQWLPAVWLGTAVISSAREVGMLPYCIGRMWTAIQKHTAGDKILKPFCIAPQVLSLTPWVLCDN